MLTYTETDVALALIDRPPKPSRLELTPDGLGELADDLAQNGQLQRVGVAGPDVAGRYVIGWGDRRCAAARLLQWATIAARVYPAGTDLVLLKAAENEQREQLSPLEQAGVVQELLDGGRPLAEVARVLRRSPAWVQSRLDLLRFPPELRAAVHAGELPMTVARELASIDHDSYRAELVREACRTGATATTARVWTAHYHADRERIVHNHLAVEQILQSRAAYVVYYNCDACRRAVDYRETLSFRFCPECGESLGRGLQAASAAPPAAPAAGGPSL